MLINCSKSPKCDKCAENPKCDNCAERGERASEEHMGLVEKELLKESTPFVLYKSRIMCVAYKL